ncbi:MAG: chemotaxis protein CheA [Deltaproteobacteria bacterium]|nr:chemotaxis protein CheA [Deltaproteobacteria bacterium]HCH62676.1 chemotaxis protein CheA [Deltaproteobacteria bacterium]
MGLPLSQQLKAHHMDSETKEIIDCFIGESREAIAEVEPLLMELEAEGGTPDRATVDAIFRLFHSMKGSAGFLELVHVETVTHHAETLLDRVRIHGHLSVEVVDLLCRALDFTNEALDCVERTLSDANMAASSQPLIERMERVAGLPPGTVEGVLEAPAAETLYGFELPPEPQALDADRSSTVPGLALVSPNVTPLRPPLDGRSDPIEDEDAALAATLQRFASASPELEPSPPTTGHILAEASRSERTAKQRSSGASNRSRRRMEYLRVDVRKLDELMDLIGELIIAETAVTHGPQQHQPVEGPSKAAVQLNRVTRDLQDVAMSLRMVPIGPTFNKMKRLVRDLSLKQGKRIRFDVSGSDTEVDKSVVEAIADPLMHLLRNAIDHGIEPEVSRLVVDKQATGVIRLTARQQAGEIRVTVQDDGRGLERRHILRKAIDAGLVRDGGDDLSDSDVFRLIFEPGFSTAPAVTDISGRGVGMDVVRRNIEAVKGRVDISSIPGQGTTVTIRIPLTLAIIEGMLVRVGSTRLTIPMLSILETVVVGPADITRLTNGVEVARIRGQMLPVFRIHQFYEIEPDSTNIHEGLLVVVEDGDDRLCLLVDELVGQRQTVIKPLSGYLGHVRGLAGCTVLGDGSISLIIDVAKLIVDTRASTAA